MVTCKDFIVVLLITVHMVLLQYGMADSKLRLVRVKECPQQLQGNEWQMAAEDHCGYGVNASLYHCVREQVSGFVQLCIQPIVIAKGFYVLWSDAAYRLYPDSCPEDRYQEVDMLSNKFYQCEKKKSLCDEPGMLTSDCDDGGTTRDRMCRCDYMKDYVADIYAFSNEQNKTCFNPGTAHGGCTHIPCGKSQVMNKAYQCIDKCQEGYYMPDMSMECVSIPVSSTTASTMEALNTTTWPVTASVSPEVTVVVGDEDVDDQLTLMRVILTVFFVFVLSVVIVTLVSKKLKKYSGGMDLRKEHSVHARPFHELEDLHEYNIQSSVGFVYAEDSQSNSTGTGFLITNNYVVTAFHVVEDIFFHVWLDVLEALGNFDSGIDSIEKAKKIKQKEFKKDRILQYLQNITISEVKEKLREKKEKDKIQRIEDTFYDAMRDGIFKFRIVFNMVYEEDSGNLYNFSLDTKYISVDDDIVILTLLDTNGLPSRPLHISAEISDLNKEFDIYGYPYPYKMLLVDQKCKALSRKDVKWICHTGGKKFFKDLRKEKKIKGIKLADYNIRHDSYYFHCTATMYHGASGAPGIIYKPDERTGAVYPTVVCMLIRGHPRFVFRSHMLNVHLDDKACLKYLIEEGATFKNCLKFLSEPTHLRNSSVIDAEEGSSEPLMSDKWKSTKQRQRPNSEPAYSNISESVRKIQRHFSDPGDRPDIDFEIDGQDKYVSFDERTDRLPYIPLTRVQIDTIKHE